MQEKQQETRQKHATKAGSIQARKHEANQRWTRQESINEATKQCMKGKQQETMYVKCKVLEKNLRKKVAWYQARKYKRKLGRILARKYATKEQLKKFARTYATKYAKNSRKEPSQKGRTDLLKKSNKEKGQKQEKYD